MRELLVREINSCDLGVEGSGAKGAEQGCVGGVAIERGVDMRRDESYLAERREILRAVRSNIIKGLVGEEIIGAPVSYFSLSYANAMLAMSQTLQRIAYLLLPTISSHCSKARRSPIRSP